MRFNADQTDWNKHLTAIEVAYNSSHQESTQKTPFELNYGREIFLPRQVISQGISTPAVLDFITTLEANLQHAKSALVKGKERQTSNANTKRRETQFQLGDKVRLSTHDLSFSGNLSRSFPYISTVTALATYLKDTLILTAAKLQS